MANHILTLGGHCGSGIQVVSSGFHFTIQYGHIYANGAMKVDLEIKEIGKEDMVKLATILLMIVLEE
jgi:hypothetical protein